MRLVSGRSKTILPNRPRRATMKRKRWRAMRLTSLPNTWSQAWNSLASRRSTICSTDSVPRSSLPSVSFVTPSTSSTPGCTTHHLCGSNRRGNSRLLWIRRQTTKTNPPTVSVASVQAPRVKLSSTNAALPARHASIAALTASATTGVRATSLSARLWRPRESPNEKAR